MSLVYCENCGKLINTHLDYNHFAEDGKCEKEKELK